MNKLEKYLYKNLNSKLYAYDIAKILKDTKEDDFYKSLNLIPNNILGKVILALPDRFFNKIINQLTINKLVIIIQSLESDDELKFMQELKHYDSEISSEVFKKLNKYNQQQINSLSIYKYDEAGFYMQLETFKATQHEIVDDVIKRFKGLKKNNKLKNISKLFIIDEEKKLKYSIALEELLFFDFHISLIENIQNFNLITNEKYAKDTEDIKDVIHYFKEYDLSVIPIIDKNNVLVGRITSDDVYDIMNEQATEQIYHLAGVDEEAEEEDDILKATKTRVIWLAINLMTAIGASIVIALFSDTLNSMVALAILMPIVASMGGNAGTQSLTVVVRQLALDKIILNSALLIIKKEVIISIINGLLFSIVIGIVSYIWFDMPMLAVVIAISMIVNLFIAGFFGAIIPLLLKRMNIDPAIGSTVILTTITDIIGFLSFLGLATIILL